MSLHGIHHPLSKAAHQEEKQTLLIHPLWSPDRFFFHIQLRHRLSLPWSFSCLCFDMPLPLFFCFLANYNFTLSLKNKSNNKNSKVVLWVVPRQNKGTLWKVPILLDSFLNYLSNDFIVGIRYHSLDDLNGQALAWCRKVNNRVHGTTNKIPAQQLAEECLQPMLREYITDNLCLFFRLFRSVHSLLCFLWRKDGHTCPPSPWLFSRFIF